MAERLWDESALYPRRMAQRRSRRRVSAEDVYRLRFVSDAQVSPDGEQVAYVVSWADPDDHTRYRSQLMLAPFDGSSPPRALTSGKHRDTSPRWSPDGARIAFLSDRDSERSQLWSLPLGGGEPRQLTDLKRGAGTPVWSPDGARLAFSARVDVADIADQEGQSTEKGKQPRVKIITRVRHKGDGEGYTEALRKHLFVVSADADEPKQVTDGDWDDTEPTWSPDGALLAFVSSRERDRDLTWLSDVFVVPSSGGRARRVTRHKGQAGSPVFSPDGETLAYLGHERGWTYGARTELLLVPVAGGESRAVCEGFDAEVSNAALSDARDPFAVLPPAWQPDGKALLALVSRMGRVEVLRFALDGSQPSVVVGGEREVAAFSTSRDVRRLAMIVSDPAHPYEVFAFDGASERRLSSENDAYLDSVELACAEPVQFTSSDGVTVHGWLMKPPGFSERRKWPLVLEIHGGPETMYAATFFHEFQVLAANGSAVLYTNPRGSKGYGEEFTARIHADWGNQDAADCMAAVDFALRECRWVDAARLGVTGGSYGGYMTGWLLGHTDRFRAAVSQRGLYNWVSFYGTSDIGPWFGDYVLGGPVYDRFSLYVERSPITYAKEMRTPLRIMHSEQDLRCPVEQAEQLFVQLRRIGKCEVDFVRFPEESHNLSRSGRPDRRVERLERIAGWFATHLV